MSGKVKVSICVPVYNNEKYLPYFLDSALQQSFEDYEIILADNHSTDGSLEILRRYESAFPGKVFAFQTDEHGGPGKGRNLAFQKSSGEYIYWCDCDDLLHPKALERLYEEADKHNADMVCAWGLRVEETGGEIMRVVPYSKKSTQQVSNDVAVVGGVEFWLRLIRRSLVEEIGPMPDDVIFDDVRYLAVMHSYAQVIRYLDAPIYYWYKRGASTTSTVQKELCIDSVHADQYILKNCAQTQLQTVQKYVGIRIAFQLRDRWPYFDLFVTEARGYSSWLYSNEQIKTDKRLFDKLRWADSLADIQFPNIVYVDGFCAPPDPRRLEELREKVFHDGCEVMVLSEKTCDVGENEYVKRAYDSGDMVFVAGYFALKKIYENGGVFIHKEIRLLNYFSFLKYQNAFFALLDKTMYSDRIFGASAGNEAVGAILKTYSDAWDKQRTYPPLSERISIILTAKYGIPQDGRNRLFQETVSVLAPELSAADTRFGSPTRLCAFEHDFSAYVHDPDYITLPRRSLQALMFPPPVRGKSPREIALERELADMKKTNTYKLMMKIRQIGDGPMGPFLKKIFHGLLKIRARFKRK